MSSIFSKIIAGEISAHKIAENENFLAFLDISPLVLGHVLVIPKQEIDYIFDIEDELYQGLMLFAKNVALAIKKAYPCERIGVSVIGLEVPHAHVHLMPIDKMDDMNFSNAKLKLSHEQFAEIAAKIKAEL